MSNRLVRPWLVTMPFDHLLPLNCTLHHLIVFTETVLCFNKNQIKEGRIHGIRRSPSSFLPTKKRGYRQMDRRTDGPEDRPMDSHTLLMSRGSQLKSPGFFFHGPNMI